MLGNLAKSPLAALIYASLLHFIAVFLPFSEPYSQVLIPFEQETSIFGHLMLPAYSLFIAAAAAIAFFAVEKTGLRALLSLLPVFLGYQWIIPLAGPLFLGEPTGVLTQWDIIMRLVQGCAGTITLILLCMLLFTPKHPEQAASDPKAADPKTPEKKARGRGLRKLRLPRLTGFMLALPFIYIILYFLLGYFLGWTSEAVRVYYNGGENRGLMDMLITMLLEQPQYVGVALLRGLMLVLFSLPLMLLLPLKRLMFIILNVMLYLCGALLYILPDPLMPDGVRITHLIVNAAVLAVYGGAAGFMLHICLRKDDTPATEPEPEPPPQAAEKAAPKPAKAKK